MKHLRTILWVGLALALLVNYQLWTAEFAPRDAAAAAAAQAAVAKAASQPTAVPQIPEAAGTPAATAPPTAGSDVPVVAAPATAAQPEAPAAADQILNVRTDVLDVDISLRGGELTRADLLAYPVVKGQPTPVRLLRNQGQGNQYLL